MKLNKKTKGFTIVELVIVLGVIGVLSAVLIPTFVNLTGKANETALQSNLANAYSAYAAEAADGKIDEGANAGKAITFKAQSDVSLTFQGNTYIFNSTDSKWVTGSAKANFVVTAAGDAAANEAASTFNGAVVKC